GHFGRSCRTKTMPVLGSAGRNSIRTSRPLQKPKPSTAWGEEIVRCLRNDIIACQNLGCWYRRFTTIHEALKVRSTLLRIARYSGAASVGRSRRSAATSIQIVEHVGRDVAFPRVVNDGLVDFPQDR